VKVGGGEGERQLRESGEEEDEKREGGGGRGSRRGRNQGRGRRERREESGIVSHVMACDHTESQSSC